MPVLARTNAAAAGPVVHWFAAVANIVAVTLAFFVVIVVAVAVTAVNASVSVPGLVAVVSSVPFAILGVAVPRVVEWSESLEMRENKLFGQQLWQGGSFGRA